MKSLGEYLRAERLARGMSLEQISADTKITMSMLQAIEKGDIERLPAPVFTKGFLRAYAEQIGLDPEAVIVQYQDFIEEADSRQQTMEMFHQRLRPEPWKKRVLALLLALPLLVGLTLLLHRFTHVWQGSPPATTGEPVEIIQESETISANGSVSGLPQVQPATPSQKTLEPTMAGVGPEPARPEFNSQSPVASPADATAPFARESRTYPEDEPRQQIESQPPTTIPYALEVKATETTWLRISIDEMQAREYLLQPGEHVTWRAKTGYKLHIGNAAGLQLYLNDKPIKPLGKSGRVVHLELPDPSLLNK